MLTYKYKNGPFSIIEEIGKSCSVHSTGQQSDVQLVIELLLNSEGPLLKGNHKCFELYIPNFVVDVSQREDIIFRNIHKSTRADIRKAQENKMLTYKFNENPTDNDIREFSNLYNRFAKRKKISKCNKDKLRAIRDAHSLIMTSVQDEQEQILSASMLLVDKESSQLYGLYGVSNRFSHSNQENKNLIAKANKFLQWKEIQLAKQLGLIWYNFGGEVSRLEHQGVNDFKRRFGTSKAIDRRTYKANSFLGKICVTLLYYKWNRYMKSYSVKPSTSGKCKVANN